MKVRKKSPRGKRNMRMSQSFQQDLTLTGVSSLCKKLI